MDVAEDLYSKTIIEEYTFEDLQDTYNLVKIMIMKEKKKKMILKWKYN